MQWAPYQSCLGDRDPIFFFDTSGTDCARPVSEKSDNTVNEVTSAAADSQDHERARPIAAPGAMPPAAENKPQPPEVPVIKLSPEQQKVLDMVKTGKNVFFTGPAGNNSPYRLSLICFSTNYPTGTGKSVLLRAIIDLHRLPNGSISKDLAITASTGIAGLNIGGSTLHSFAGVGLGKGTAQSLASRVLGSKRLTERWTTTKTLIVDESMYQIAPLGITNYPLPRRSFYARRHIF